MDTLDHIDLQLLHILQEDGRISQAELAQRVNLTPPSVQRRVRLLEERGYIKGYTALLDPVALGFAVTAFIFVESHAGSDLSKLSDDLTYIPEIQEIHRVIGEWCFILKVRTDTPRNLERLLYQDLRQIPEVRRTLTILSTSSPRETTHLPITLSELQPSLNGAL